MEIFKQIKQNEEEEDDGSGYGRVGTGEPDVSGESKTRQDQQGAAQRSNGSRRPQEQGSHHHLNVYPSFLHEQPFLLSTVMSFFPRMHLASLRVGNRSEPNKRQRSIIWTKTFICRGVFNCSGSSERRFIRNYFIKSQEGESFGSVRPGGSSQVSCLRCCCFCCHRKWFISLRTKLKMFILLF